MLSFSPHLHSIDSYWTKIIVSFTPDIKLSTFALMWFILYGRRIQAYRSSITLQSPTHSLTLAVIKRLIRVYID